ncbi:MAG: hypothetical protein WC792_02660 [Candidatus Micrarchaeia archaeon]
MVSAGLSRVAFLGAVLVFSVALAGCLGGAADLGCGLLSGKDRDHCYQGLGTTFNDGSLCPKIQGADFKSVGSNPPKDKCYLMVANNTENFDTCNNIEGGLYSYSPAECVDNVASKKLDRDYAEIQRLQTELAANPTDAAKQQELQLKMADMQKMYEMMSNIEKSQHEMQMAPIRNLRG